MWRCKLLALAEKEKMAFSNRNHLSCVAGV